METYACPPAFDMAHTSSLVEIDYRGYRVAYTGLLHAEGAPDRANGFISPLSLKARKAWHLPPETVDTVTATHASDPDAFFEVAKRIVDDLIRPDSE